MFDNENSTEINVDEKKPCSNKRKHSTDIESKKFIQSHEVLQYSLDLLAHFSQRFSDVLTEY